MLFLWLYRNPVTIRRILYVALIDCEGELQGNPLSRLGRVSVALNNSRVGQSSITLLYDIFLYNSPPFLC